MAETGKGNGRAELREWYLEGLRPKLARAARRGAVDPREILALDADVRALLDIVDARDDGA